MAVKTYVLLEHLNTTAPIYYVLSKEKRVRIDKVPRYPVYLTYTFTTDGEDGTQKTIRFKLNAKSIDLEDQIKQGILANEKFTTKEREMRYFKNGVLVTGLKIFQDYLEASPEIEGFKGYCADISQPSFKLVDHQIEAAGKNQSFLNNLAAANKIANIELAEAKELLTRVYGTHYKLPTTKLDAQNALIEYMDSSDLAVAEINKETVTVDDEIKVLIGKLINGGLLSFDVQRDQVCKKRNEEWIPIREISGQYMRPERERYFSEFLTTSAGLTLLADLKKDSESLEPKIVKDVIEKEIIVNKNINTKKE